MAGVREVYRKLVAAKEALPDVSEDSIDQTKSDWIELNQDQMLRGQNREGEKLGRYKNTKYAAMKNRLNALPGLGNKDYRLHSDYYKGMFLVVDNGMIRQGSIDEKAKWLENGTDKRYGLQPENKKDYIQRFLRPVFNQLFLQKLK